MGYKSIGKDVIEALTLKKPTINLDNDGHNPKPLAILIKPNIGLEEDIRLPVVEILNRSLANESILSQKTRSALWNSSGSRFFELHIFFETQYKQLDEISDKIAERTRMLGGVALSSFKLFLAHSQLEEETANAPDILHLLADHESIIRFLRGDIRQVSEEYEDEGTVELLVGVMSLHEKMAWMLRSYIENEPVNGGSQKRNQTDE
jgi:starvation-inducible DNA-binding protein